MLLILVTLFQYELNPIKLIRFYLVFLISILSLEAVSQSDYYSVFFKDKAGSDRLVPSDFLSSKSILRRTRSQVEISNEDFPISPNYLEEIGKIEGILIKNRLKWTNEITVAVSNPISIENIEMLPFVKSVQFICSFPNGNRVSNNKFAIEKFAFVPNYGKSKTQIEMIGMDQLQQKGYTGKGKLIAVFDNGFRTVESLNIFNHLWVNNQIIGFKDYVNKNDSVFHNGTGTHGTSVLSTMALKSDGQMIGTAPDADYYLMITEDNQSESLIEEYNWAEAAEFADSLGVDVINSSLGYTVFDDTTTNHTYADMDGNTTVITRAANKAFEKGILVVNSAGNSGNNKWHYIGAPADGYGVLSIGAVDSVEVLANFSSRGPTSNGMIKPDVCAMGSRVYVANTNGEINKSNGTSFSGPIIAGSAACLWQAHPEMSNKDLMEVIRKSAHLYANPNNDYGYGIPNFNTALQIAENQKKEDEENGFYSNFQIYPNPANDFTKVEFVISTKTKNTKIEVFNLQGALIISNEIIARRGHNIINVDCLNLNAGSYVVRLVIGDEVFTKSFIVAGKIK